MNRTQHPYKPGDWVVYSVVKRSAHPGPRAQSLTPEPMGEQYVYQVGKFWVVQEVTADGRLVLRTRRGKQRIVPAGDPDLRPATWLERLRYRRRFVDAAQHLPAQAALMT